MFRNNFQSYLFIALLLIISGGCLKEKYSFGDLKAPSDLTLATTVVGATQANPDGDGSGTVQITTTASNALTYKIDFGDGTSKVIPSGSTTYKFTTPGKNTFTITVNAIGTGGAMSTISKKVTVFVAFEIPADLLAALTGGSSKTWVTDKNAMGHFGVGPSDQFAPIWWEAPPNGHQPCAYDDEITFIKNANNTISMSIDNKGTSFSIGAATGVYGMSGADGCYAINTGGTRPLSFSNATSGSTSAVSSGIQFSVPGNGIVNFGTGGNVYEILSFTSNTLFLRNIGADGNAWYQKLTVKP